MRALAIAHLVTVSALFASPQVAEQSAAEASCLTVDLVHSLATAPLISGGRFQQEISERKLCFELTGEIIERLKEAGASAEKLLILSNMRAESLAAQVKPVDTSGSLAIECSPAECRVVVSGKDHGQTQKGRMTIPRVPSGTLFVDLSRGDPPYIGVQVQVTIQPGQTVEIRETLEPSFDARLQFGRELFLAMIEALGGREALEETKMFTASGRIKVFSQTGEVETFSAELKAKVPIAISIATTDAKGKSASVMLNSQSTRRPERLKGQPPASVQKMARSFELSQVASLIDYIESRGFKLFAEAPLADKPAALVAESPVEVIRLELDRETRLPAAVRREIEGVGITEQVRWHDFVLVGRAQTPRRVLLTFTPDSKESVELDFESVALAPKLTPADFK